MTDTTPTTNGTTSTTKNYALVCKRNGTYEAMTIEKAQRSWGTIEGRYETMAQAEEAAYYATYGME